MIVFNVLLGEDTLMEKIKDSSNKIKKKLFIVVIFYIGIIFL